MKLRTAVLFLGVMITCAVAYLTYKLAIPEELGFEGSEPFSIISVSTTACLLLIGLIFGCIFRQISGRKDAVNLFAELSILLRSSSFLSALCVSPFVFMSVYALVKDAPGDPASMLLAFQNGFFCESIFSKLFPTQIPNVIER